MQALIVDAEVVGDLVHHGDRHDLDHAKKRGVPPWATFGQLTVPDRCLPLLRR